MNQSEDEPHAITPNRCNAKTRSGSKCKAYPMANGRCRMHGGPSKGPKTEEGLRRSQMANYKHGRYSKIESLIRRNLSDILKMLQSNIENDL